ncbi:MAG: hypothetical protein ACQESP_02685 [Candidatus Muiribacteriota bacterium]
MKILNINKLKLLSNAYKKNNLSHAYLFSGDIYGGQKILAYNFAAYLLCSASDKTVQGKPCNKCQMCKLILENSHPDLHVFKPDKDKTVIPVDQIRKMINQSQKKPYYEGKSVFVVEDIDLMNVAGHNSLLKTLEEPSPNSIFLLTTSKKNSLLDTILSRVTNIQIPPVKLNELSTEFSDLWSNEEFKKVALKCLYLPEVIMCAYNAEKSGELEKLYNLEGNNRESLYLYFSKLLKKKNLKSKLYIRTVLVFLYLDFLFDRENKIIQKISALNDLNMFYVKFKTKKNDATILFSLIYKYFNAKLRNNKDYNIIDRIFKFIDKLQPFENYYQKGDVFEILNCVICEMEEKVK